MKTNTSKAVFRIALAAMTLTVSSCVDEVSPTDSVTEGQLGGLSSSLETMLNGIVSFTNDLNTWGATGDEAYYLNDWGYPCQMMFRDVLTADFPTASSSYNYWSYSEQNTYLSSSSYYTYRYYYEYVKNCNNLIAKVDPGTAETASLNYLGCALVFRALCYLDMARLFEFQPTGYTALDSKAESAGIFGLTVPIVTEKSTLDDMRHNPRAPFYTMYRFILTDLNNAAEYLNGYQRKDGTYPDRTVAYGLLARFWLEAATRFKNSPEDLAAQIAHEGDSDGYQALGITSAKDCYANASKYARLAESGYTPMTQEQWTEPSTGFNTATDAWMFFSRVSTKEQEGLYYSNFLGTVCTEAAWGMAQYGPYRMISKYLYDKMGDNDWRKLSWISPDDAGKAPAAKYRIATWSKTDATTNTVTTSNDMFKKYPAYANLKFRTRDNTDQIEGMLADMPMMRVEEMYFIDAEATANAEGVSSGVRILEDFMNTYRYTDNSYVCSATDIDSFTDELFTQKRIEFWGEGLSYFDYKRLKKPVLRTEAGNYLDAYQQDSKDGYVCPAMNYYILDYAKNQNDALVLNPDCSGWYNLE